MGFLDIPFIIDRLPLLLQGTVYTIQLTFFAIIFGTLIGLLVAFGKIVHNPLLNALSSLYTWIFRGIPLLVQLFIIYYGLGSLGIKWLEFSSYEAAVIGLSLCGGAYIAEILRAGIQSIDKGQLEAAYSLGMNWRQAMFRIIIPQAYRRLLPPMGNEFISLLKDTSLVAIISMTELLKQAQTQANASFKPFEMYITAGIIYLILTTFFTLSFSYIEKKLATHD